MKHKDKPLMPFTKSIISNSIYFKNCIANSPWPLPSHYSMFTGLYPTQIKQISNGIKKLSVKIPILTEILKSMGYFTISSSENVHISQKFGLTRGFDVIINNWKLGVNFSRLSRKLFLFFINHSKLLMLFLTKE